MGETNPKQFALIHHSRSFGSSEQGESKFVGGGSMEKRGKTLWSEGLLRPPGAGLVCSNPHVIPVPLLPYFI